MEVEGGRVEENRSFHVDLIKLPHILRAKLNILKTDAQRALVRTLKLFGSPSILVSTDAAHVPAAELDVTRVVALGGRDVDGDDFVADFFLLLQVDEEAVGLGAVGHEAEADEAGVGGPLEGRVGALNCLKFEVCELLRDFVEVELHVHGVRHVGVERLEVAIFLLQGVDLRVRCRDALLYYFLSGGELAIVLLLDIALGAVFVNQDHLVCQSRHK